MGAQPASHNYSVKPDNVLKKTLRTKNKSAAKSTRSSSSVNNSIVSSSQNGSININNSKEIKTGPIRSLPARACRNVAVSYWSPPKRMPRTKEPSTFSMKAKNGKPPKLSAAKRYQLQKSLKVLVENAAAKRRPYFTVKGMDRAVEMIKNQHTEEGWRETGGTSKWIFLAGLGLQPTNNMSAKIVQIVIDDYERRKEDIRIEEEIRVKKLEKRAERLARFKHIRKWRLDKLVNAN